MKEAASRWLVPAYLALCIVFGGASAGGYLANAGLQLLAVGLIGYTLRSQNAAARHRASIAVRVLSIALAAIIVVQFVPLPAGLWRALPGRAEIYAPLREAGIAMSYGFVSLSPHESLASAMWLLPPIGVYLAMTRGPLTYSERGIAFAIIGAMCAAVLVGAMQRTAGGGSALYFYEITNRGTAVGFFANANHMASLLLVTIPFQAALLQAAMAKEKSLRATAVILVLASLALTVAGIAVVGSLAGYGLLVPAVLASALIVRSDRRLRILGGAALVAALLLAAAYLTAASGGQRILDQASGMAYGSRQEIFATTWQAIREFWPAGSGLGTFAEVYRSFEDPFAVTHTFVNHAHNDYLEVLLETGLAGAAALAGFVAWWAIKAARIWRGEGSNALTKAAAVASAILLLHSVVDYPMRTSALASVFAACLAMMVSPRRPSQVEDRTAVLTRL